MYQGDQGCPVRLGILNFRWQRAKNQNILGQGSSKVFSKLPEGLPASVDVRNETFNFAKPQKLVKMLNIFKEDFRWDVLNQKRFWIFILPAMKQETTYQRC